MKQYGYVTDIQQNRAKVRVVRESSCGGNCVSCKGCPTEAVFVECLADDSLRKGDKVVLTMPTKTFFKGMLLGYGQTVVLMIIGAILGYKFLGNEISSIIGMFGGLGLGLVISKVFASKDRYEIKAEKADKDSVC